MTAKTQNMLCTARPGKEPKEQRLLNLIFQRVEAIDTLKKTDQAIRNVEEAQLGCEAWMSEHRDKEGYINKEISYDLYSTFEAEKSCLETLEFVYDRRLLLLNEDDKEADPQ